VGVIYTPRCPYIISKGTVRLYRTQIDLYNTRQLKKFPGFKIAAPGSHINKKFPRGKKLTKGQKHYIKRNAHISNMKLEFDDYEKDLLLETIQHRLYTDKILVINNTRREEIEDLLRKVEEDEYL